MTLRFVVDAQLPPALARHLLDEGYKAEHVNRIGLGAAKDSDVWAYARTHQAVLVTKDGDFADMARRASKGPAVIWLRTGNVTNNALWANFSRALPEILEALNAGERIIAME